MITLELPALLTTMQRSAATSPIARLTLANKPPKLVDESIGLLGGKRWIFTTFWILANNKREIERNLAALAGDVQSPLGPQEQQEEGKSEVQQGTQVDDQESNWSAPDGLKRFKVEDEGGDIDGGGVAT